MMRSLVRRDRVIIIAALVPVLLLSWAYVIAIANYMTDPSADMATMPGMGPWRALDAAFMFLMWVVMMIAMMTPTVIPTLYLFTSIWENREGTGSVRSATAALLSGYLAAWAGFSSLATALQWALHTAALLSPMEMNVNAKLGGTLLIAAGVYQFTPMKRACLSKCRSPLGFFLSEWRGGARGAFAMGWSLGLYCVGCCWLLMALLFVVGAMYVAWIAALVVVVLIEKLAPGGEWVARGIGLIACLGGVWLLAS